MPVRHLILCCLLCLTMPALRAQQGQYHLKGFMGVQGGESFTYRLELKDSTRDMLSGYAYTYLNEKNDVKAYVVAVIDRYQRTLRIREERIIYNNYFRSNALICLVEALLQYNVQEHTLSGPLMTMTAGYGADCSSGSITFTDAGELNQLFNPSPAGTPVTETTAAPPPPKPKPGKPVKFVYDTLSKAKPVPAAATAVKAPEKITEGKDKTYNWHSDQIVLELWDGNNVDNDRITVLLNGTEVLKNYILSKEKKKLSFPTGGNELNIITIVADNEGADPPNTANILLWDNETSYDIIAHNTVGKKALIKIRKK